MELVVMVDVLRRVFVGRIIVVIFYFGYAR